MKDTKIQWHPGFVAAMNLEFAKDREGLIFEKEYNLNTKPLEVDLLVIKKGAGIEITNENRQTVSRAQYRGIQVTRRPPEY